MVATSAHHVVRLTVRVSVATIHREIDVTLPTSSTMAEVLPELARMVDLPKVHRPWQATTAAGAPLDMHTPLHELKLFDGSILTLTPIEPPNPPVVRDAAESLRDAAERARDIHGVDLVATVAGVAGLGVLVATATPLPAAVGAAALTLFLLAVLARSRALFAGVPAVAGAAAELWVAGDRVEWVGALDPALGVLAAALTAAVAVAVGAVLRLAGPGVTAFYLTASALLSTGALGAWLPSPLAPAALTVLAGVLTVMATPGIASRAAGLAIPRIPTAGEEFDASDGYQLDVDDRSANAVAIAAGLSCAVAACAVPALMTAAFRGGAWVLAFALCTSGALGLHASRHHYPAARIPLLVTALAAAGAGVIAVVRTDHPHPALMAVAAVVVLATATAALWAPRVPELEPTTVVWLERAEAVAIIAVLPLAVHLTGLFALIRGL